MEKKNKIICLLVVILFLVVAYSSLLLTSKNSVVVKKSRSKSSSIIIDDDIEQNTGITSTTNFRTNVYRCPEQSITELESKRLLKSQQKEDVQLLEWFNGLCGGTYIEMGALDGIRYSNTFAFNSAFDWNGLLIELSPTNYKKLVINRPNDTTINAAVCDSTPHTIHVYEPKDGAVAGIWEYTAESFRKRYWGNVELEGTTPVECMPLTTIIEQQQKQQNDNFNNNNHNENEQFIYYYDFFSLDIEGGEYMALQSINFNKIGFGIIIVESDSNNQRKNLSLKLFLQQHGYEYILRTGNNDWFANKQFHNTYKDFIH